MLKIENAPGWVKDPSSKAVLNTDLSALEQRKQNKTKTKQINSLENDLINVKTEIEEMKTDIKDIKNILLQIFNSKL